jgi:hypothetical protein
MIPKLMASHDSPLLNNPNSAHQAAIQLAWQKGATNI